MGQSRVSGRTQIVADRGAVLVFLHFDDFPSSCKVFFMVPEF